MFSFLVFIVIFGAIVFFHELGHFIFAKKAGILCREFAIGFGPKIFSFEKNETKFTIRLLPLGGYVSMAGEEAESVNIKPGQQVGLILNDQQKVSKILLNESTALDESIFIEVDEIDLENKLFVKGWLPDVEKLVSYECEEYTEISNGRENYQIAPFNRQFKSKSFVEKILTIGAGPIFNFIFAFVILFFMFLFFGTPSNQIERIIEDSPAYQYGLKRGDIIKSIDGVNINYNNSVQKIIADHPNEQLNVTVERKGEEKVILLQTEQRSQTFQKQSINQGYVGIEINYIHSVKDSLLYAKEKTVTYTIVIIQSLKDLVIGNLSWENLSGPVGIYKVTDTVSHLGIYPILNFAAFISINLGIVNLIPIPALDGGRILLILLEAIRGKSLPQQAESIIHLTGFVILMLVMLLVTWKDIMNLV
ncbi:RIP metalloprotease RseP [Bacillus sp. T_4]|nr:RIP metalloprotease RseP [Bacillus sp. T_4]